MTWVFTEQCEQVHKYMRDRDLDSGSEQRQLEVLMEAFSVYVERNAKRSDHWREIGWRGNLVHVRGKAERAFRQLWNASPDGEQYDIDDLIDIINYAAMTIRLVREGTPKARNGSWWEIIDEQARSEM